MTGLTYDPDLVEEAVLLADSRRLTPAGGSFRRERNKIYEIADAERRERRFRSFHADWFALLGLGRVVEQLVRERPSIARGLDAGRVVRALAADEEGADLVDCVVPGSSAARPFLLLRIRPPSLLDAGTLAARLRHELLHVVDMLDPHFGYERTLPSSGDGPSHDALVRDRYRVLWDVTIDGRLSGDGLGNEATRVARRGEFERVFGGRGDGGPQAFDTWFECRQPTHQAFVAFITST